MQHIPLSQGQVAIVDDADYPLLADFRWSYRAERGGRLGYAVRHTKVEGKDRLAYLHREIMQPPPGQEVIFLNHNRLDCRRGNLKVVSKEEARRHHRVRRDSKSGVKGVRYNPEGGTWSAVTYRDGRCHTIGTFYRLEEAEAAYRKALRRENPDLHSAPQTVARPSDPRPVQRGNPDAAGLGEAQ
jgi:hypothetical protein